MKQLHDIVGEFFGTFILVFFGCGSVVTAVCFDAHTSLTQIALIWGVGVSLAIYATRHLSNAHLNPAVSIAMAVSGRMSASKLPAYIISQFVGAFVGAAVLYGLFNPSIEAYEAAHNIVRGSQESIQTAKMFGEYYTGVSHGTAFFAEFVGTFMLVIMIFALTEGCNVGRPDDSIGPLFIGLTVMAIICIIAPLTQAGLNPARDLAPRLFSYLAGWKDVTMPADFGAITVYVLAPILGAITAAFTFTKLIEPLMDNKK